MTTIPDGACQVIINMSSVTVRKGVTATIFGFNTGGSSLDAIALAADTSWATHMVPLTTTEFVYTGTRVQDATSFSEASTTTNGARAGAAAPPNTAMLLHKFTGMRGPGKHGQSFLPGFLLDADVNDSGGVATDVAHDVFVAFSAWISDLAVVDATPCIIHFSGASAGGVTDISGFAVDEKIASQRRRLRKGSGRRRDT